MSKTAEEDDPLPALNYLMQEIPDYWDRCQTIIALLNYPPLKDFLATQLQGTHRYDRIAGFFSSSLLEVAGEALERMTPEGGETCVRMVCNSCLNPLDVQTAWAAKWGMHREWCASLPDEIGAHMKARLQRLYDFLFNRLVKETVSHSQILMITHNKKTMEIADSLYGVTMQKQGISTLVSVSLN